MFLIYFEVKVRTCCCGKKKHNFCIIPAGVTCSKSTIEVLEQSMKYVQNQEERPQNNIIDVVLEPSLLPLNIFYILFCCSDCWFWTCNTGKICKNLLYCCQIKLLEQLKLYSTKMIYKFSLKMIVTQPKRRNAVSFK